MKLIYTRILPRKTYVKMTTTTHTYRLKSTEKSLTSETKAMMEA